MMLQAFPSAQSSITAESPKVYLFAVEEYSLEALKRACRRIVRGEVADLKADFPPTAPRLAQIVKDAEDALIVERFEAEHLFIEAGSEMWTKLGLLRKHSLPVTTRTLRSGERIQGWSFKYEEVAKAERLTIPSPVSDADLQEINERLRKAGFSVGDPDGDRDAA